jgi:hypothetical protein
MLKARAAGLVAHEPLRPPSERIRQIWCPPEVDDQLAGRVITDLPSPAVALTIGQFIGGMGLGLSRTRSRGNRRKVDLERLEGVDEIWVLCYRKPRPGWRLAGRFLQRNAVVIFQIRDKRDIGNDYGPIVAQVTQDWRDRFGTQPPHSGEWISGYLSGRHYDADEGQPIEGGPP